MSTKLTETRLRTIIREEAKHLAEMGRRETRPEILATAESIFDEIGPDGVVEIQAGIEAGDRAALEALKELIDDHGDDLGVGPKRHREVLTTLAGLSGMAI